MNLFNLNYKIINIVRFFNFTRSAILPHNLPKLYSTGRFSWSTICYCAGGRGLKVLNGTRPVEYTQWHSNWTDVTNDITSGVYYYTDSVQRFVADHYTIDDLGCFSMSGSRVTRDTLREMLVIEASRLLMIMALPAFHKRYWRLDANIGTHSTAATATATAAVKGNMNNPGLKNAFQRVPIA